MRLGGADTRHETAVVAELGNNHEGDMRVARELVERAAEAGAHAVKLQAIEPRLLVRPGETARIAQLERYRLAPEQVAELAELARRRGEREQYWQAVAHDERKPDKKEEAKLDEAVAELERQV